MLWSQNHLHNPSTNVHQPLHKRLTVKTAIHPNGCQTRNLVARLFYLGVFTIGFKGILERCLRRATPTLKDS
ncbi:hypothetical protein [Nostoc sp.]|uniref:hypothetical protein n=1 Tax=Nostoc sp. TaxID=1180 RepID=UPI003FA5DECD